MDYLRGCYRTQVRLFRDSNRTFEVRWYRAPAGAKYFGYNRFSSQVWQNQKDYPDPPIGEQWKPLRIYDKGANRGEYLGQCFIGERDWFVNGAPISILSQPAPTENAACCRKQTPPLPDTHVEIEAIPGVQVTRSADTTAHVAIDCVAGTGEEYLSLHVSISCIGGFSRLSAKTLWDYRLTKDDLTTGWFYPAVWDGRWTWFPAAVRARFEGAGILYPFTMPLGGWISHYRFRTADQDGTSDDSAVRLSIYRTENDSIFLPGILVPDTTVEVPTRPAGLKTVELGPNILPPGLYWLLIEWRTNGAFMWTVARDLRDMDGFANNILMLSDGQPDEVNVTGMANNFIYCALTLPYGDAPPPVIGPTSVDPHCVAVPVSSNEIEFANDPHLPMPFLHMGVVE